MSNCTIPNWNLRLQRQEQEEAEEGINRSSHVHSQQNPSFVVPMSKYEVKELTWENGLPDMHGLGGIIRFPTATTKPTWDDKASDTLESIVHQAATSHKQSSNLVQLDHQNEKPNGSSMQLATGKLGESTTGHKQMAAADHHHAADHLLLKKRVRSEHSDQCGRYFSTQDRAERSAYASASATFCRDHDDTTKMTNWPSSESLRSVKTKTTDDDSASHGGSENRNEENQTKGETVRSVLTRNGRAAAIHNQSERRRRDRINQKMKALQKLVPNASKTDKASMLDEVIEYLKKLQAQVQMMNVRSMSQMMMPLGMHQQLQMSLFARMGMGVGLGMGMGMFDMNNIARSATHQPFPSLVHPGAAMTGAAPTFLPPPFIMPPAVPARPPLQSNIGATTNNSVPYNDPYSAFLAHQSMNIELYNKMAEIFRQQANQSQQTSGSSPQENLAQKG